MLYFGLGGTFLYQQRFASLMKKARLIFAGLFLVALFLAGCLAPEIPPEAGEAGLPLTQEEPTPTEVSKMKQTNIKLTSPAFENGGKIPRQYTCDGEDQSPPLRIEGVPGNAQTLVLIMDDPDAVKPAGKVWDHWIVFNISPSTAEIPEGQEPEGVHGKGTSGNLDYHGPCPPDAEHRYYFKLYALDVKLNLPEGSSKAKVEEAMAGHVIGQAVLIGRYLRS